ncbi:MAG: tetratricopeptide repeat protein [Caldisericota bacterium]|nr:tetratricopeptide repeat protein [Caldisericota bacterium]
MKKKLLYITILTVIVLLQFLVVKQYIADRWFKKGYSELHEYDASEKVAENTDSKPLISDSSFRKAITWDGNNPEVHYQLAKLYEKLMYRYGNEMGKWETIDNKPVYNIGWMSKYFQDLAIREYYRAISLNPCVNYYHLDLAWLLKSKLLVGGRKDRSQKSEVRSLEETEVRGRRSEVGGQPPTQSYVVPRRSEIIKEFRRATALAPNRTYNHKVFADWLVEHILYLENDTKTGDQYKKDIKALFDGAVREYKKAVSLRPSLFNEALKSMTRLTFDYNVLKPIAQEDNRRLKNLVFFLYNKKEWEENREKFLADMDLQIDQYDFNNQSPEILYPYYDTLAALLQKEKKAEKVADILQEYLKIDPGNGKIHLKLAGLALSSGKWETSVHHFKRAIEIDPDNASGRRQYVSALASHKDSITVETELKSIIRKYHEDAFSYEALGNLLLRQERFDEAEQTYRKILSDTPDKARGYALLKNLYEKQGNHEKAEAIYRKIVSVIPDKARGYYLLGKYYEARKDREKARENYKKATLLNTRYKSHFNRMIPPDMLFEEYFKTTRNYDKLKRLIPLSPDFLNKLVLFLYKKNAWDRNKSRFIADLNRTKTNYEKSKGNTNKEKRIRPWLLAYYKTLADVYVEKGNYRKAVSVLNEVVKIDPDNPEGHLLLAEYSFDNGNVHDYTWEFSKNHYEIAIALSHENYKYEKAYAVSLAGVKKFEEAENHMKKAY